MNNNKVKIFLSFPMKGKTYEQILQEKEKALKRLSELWVDTDIEVLNTIFEDISAHKPLWYLGKAIQALSEANVAVFCGEWENARGCRIEYRCANNYEIPVLLLDEKDRKSL